MTAAKFINEHSQNNEGAFLYSIEGVISTIKRYRERKFIEAVEFTDTPENKQEIISFVGGLPITVEYKPEGTFLRVIRGAFDVAVAKLGQCVVKDLQNGSFSVCDKVQLEEKYDEVTA